MHCSSLGHRWTAGHIPGCHRPRGYLWHALQPTWTPDLPVTHTAIYLGHTLQSSWDRGHRPNILPGTHWNLHGTEATGLPVTWIATRTCSCCCVRGTWTPGLHLPPAPCCFQAAARHGLGVSEEAAAGVLHGAADHPRRMRHAVGAAAAAAAAVAGAAAAWRSREMLVGGG
eukprot:scaffold49127_cov18-Tisochrysis_lutea.AAC.3